MQSMTGFGEALISIHGALYRIEVRSINHRFLDLVIRLPWNAPEMESALQSLLKSELDRGRVELSIREDTPEKAWGDIVLNEKLARSLRPVIERLAEILSVPQPHVIGLLGPIESLLECRKPTIVHAEAYQAFLEGETLRVEFHSHLARLQTLIHQVKDLSCLEPSRQKEKLLKRIAKIEEKTLAIDPVRLAQEVALFADRCDITEELERLQSHFNQLQMMFEESPVGRKLDFMLQEVLRELNTIASKTLSDAISHLVVESKAINEKMREQVSNIE